MEEGAGGVVEAQWPLEVQQWETEAAALSRNGRNVS